MAGMRALVVSLATALLAVALGGCAHSQVVGADRTLRVGLTEYRVTPGDVRVSAGLLTIFVHNYGRLTHNLVVSLNGQSAGATRPLWPGQDAVIAVTLTPGTYVMASTILSDEALGEYGTLKVTS
jgi:hypothetical protein